VTDCYLVIKLGRRFTGTEVDEQAAEIRIPFSNKIAAEQARIEIVMSVRAGQTRLQGEVITDAPASRALD
jgi:hypothetical protein